jgi:glycosyltransferase involved in cell wall biosynthesis
MMDNPFFTIVVTTCRDNTPMVNRRESNVLAMIAENCIRQTFTDFELIVVDLVWRRRKRWLEDNFGELPFPVLHIPDKESVFRDLMLTRICTARNTGLMYARGQCVVFTDDCQEWTTNALERLHDWGKKNHGATLRLFRDKGRGPYEDDSRWEAHELTGTTRTKVVGADGIGYMGGTMSMAPVDKMVECNGWDEMFDGSRQLEDADMARRLGAAGLKMALEPHAHVTEFSHDPCSGHIHRFGVSAKCNGSYIYPIWKAQPDRIVANDRVLTDDELDMFMVGECPMLAKDGTCKTSKGKCDGTGTRRSLMNIYKDSRLVFDLADQRQGRDWTTATHDPLLQV